MKEWPSGTLRLNCEVTTDATAADVFVYPGALHSMTYPMNRLLHFRGNEQRFVFFHCSDDEKLYNEKCLFIRCNTRDWYLVHDPNTISWPWPVEDFKDNIETDQFLFDVTFQGWISSAPRRQSVASVTNDLRCDIATYRDFYGYIGGTNEGLRRRKEFLRSMNQSRVALCPESIPGVFPYRFFEAMSAGRVPCLVGSHYVLPFADEIPYDKFCIFVRADHADRTAESIVRFIESHTDDEIKALGKMAREYWDRYLNSEKWVQMMTYAVEKKVGLFVAA